MNQIQQQQQNPLVGSNGTTLPVVVDTRRPSGRPKHNSYTDLMKPGESWEDLPDAAERRRIQNRLAQRAYRRNMRDRTKEVELLKSQVKNLQEAMNSNSSTPNDSNSGSISASASTSDGDDRPTRASSQVSTSSVSPGPREPPNTYFPSPDQEILGDGLNWPTDLDHDFTNCFDKTKDITATVTSMPTSTSPSTMASTASAQNAMRWLESDVYYPFPPPSPPNVDPMLRSMPSNISDTQRRIASGCSLSSRDPEADEPLIHIAISRGTIDTLQLLLMTYPISVNVRDRAGYTPLQRAVITGRTDMMKLLIEHGADAGL
ncbi:uncharacterized protein BO87DRAFT_461328 [Aspergillus neoniger CBS 115656]|uniref:Uncharacterized protein n=1 Tax=Aspergillus neoniger (strain CBS 115656) TaxID=1448310 RepID=A0A318YGD2_ASPNB|nr:hypothetical protein BO87DRAFT_461328 [Aspergillus neoniger CBS 115656]PYH31563.1 hypothetical protein BO87DRAFT_461328 [Aspergillus neoniger CBS 115656]